MAGRGRKKLKAQDILDGNPSKREIEDFGIEMQSTPFVPEHLADDARGCIECIKASMPTKVYSALDSYLLAAFGMWWAVHKQTSLKMSAPDFEILSKKGQISRWVVVLEKATEKMISLSGKLGLDPVTRQGMKVPGANQQKSKFEDLSGEIQAAQIASFSMSNSSESRVERVRAETSS
jgi:phage terminase small subunit